MSELIQDWRLQKERYQLIGEVCLRCKEFIFPSRDICPYCNGTDVKVFKFSGRGKIFSFTSVSAESAPAGFEKYAPYTIALIKLKEGPYVTAQLTDLEDTPIEFDTPVEMVTRVLSEDGDKGAITYGYKFRPLLPSAREASKSSRLQGYT
jgi:uncharacterized OB-fold protein